MLGDGTVMASYLHDRAAVSSGAENGLLSLLSPSFPECAIRKPTLLTKKIKPTAGFYIMCRDPKLMMVLQKTKFVPELEVKPETSDPRPSTLYATLSIGL